MVTARCAKRQVNHSSPAIVKDAGLLLRKVKQTEKEGGKAGQAVLEIVCLSICGLLLLHFFESPISIPPEEN